MLEHLEKTVLECGEILMRLRGGAMDAVTKDEQLGAHFSTVADHRSQEHGLALLSASFPGIPLIAEEQENDAVLPSECIVFDPLDGTTNYYNRSDDFGVTVAYLKGGVAIAGATYFPVRNLLVSAERGKGCFIGILTKTRYEHIPWHGNLDKVIVVTDVGSWTHKSGTFESVLRPISERYPVVSTMSAIEAGRRVLFGEAGVYYNIGIAKVWDAAAMALAIEEAGGAAVDPSGEKLSLRTLGCDWVVAANDELAEIVLKHTK